MQVYYLNEAIATLLEELNNRPFKKLIGSRRSHFESYEKSALKPLPKHRYEFVVIKNAQVNLDYHVEVNEHYYSVPHQYIGKSVDYHLSEQVVSLFHNNQRIAIHKRSAVKRRQRSTCLMRISVIMSGPPVILPNGQERSERTQRMSLTTLLKINHILSVVIAFT